MTHTHADLVKIARRWAAQATRSRPSLAEPVSIAVSVEVIGPLTVAYEDIIVGALILVGIGLSFMVLPVRR